MRILLVDDDPLQLSIFSAILRDRGHQVDAIDNGEAALASFREHCHPLMLVDWDMPGMNGIELVEMVRALPDGEAPMILMVTGRSEHEDMLKALAVGANDYITKPFSAQLLELRLTIAEQQSVVMRERHNSRRRLEQALERSRRGREDLAAILDQLEQGTVLCDETGGIRFLNYSVCALFRLDREADLGRHWLHTFPFTSEELESLEQLVETPDSQREHMQLGLQRDDGRRFWMDTTIHDDPREEGGYLFLFHDVTEVHDLRRMLDEKAQFQDFVGKSRPMLQVYRQIQELAEVDITVLVNGETGTGKELVARALHNTSHRKDEPFIAVNCAGLTDSLLTSQLFGHRKGAFTGAISDHKGLFEEADGGTLFLDEIGEISMNVQTALLRVLQEREVIRVGENTPRKVDVRLIFATHRDLTAEVEAGRFRADLMYRIRVAQVRLAPLRERREDIPMLADYFLGRVRTASGKALKGISTDAMRRLTDHAWPGNVRELENTIEVSAVRARGHYIEEMDLPPELLTPAPFIAPQPTAGAQLPAPAYPAGYGAPPPLDERSRLLAALQQSGGNRKRAAELMGISRATLYRRLERFGIANER